METNPTRPDKTPRNEATSTEEKPTRDLMKDTLEEHDQCMWIVAEVEACLETRPDTEGFWVSNLLEKLSRLDAGLRAHFRVEERGPIYRQLPIKHPRLAGRAAELEGEHKLILERIRDVVAAANKLREAAPYDLHELNAQVQLLVATIQRHEAQENELVVEAHWNEVGVGD